MSLQRPSGLDLDVATGKQESCWAPPYTRPPTIRVAVGRKVKVTMGGTLLAETSKALQVLETSHPPTYYIPREDCKMDQLRRSSNSANGRAAKEHVSYFDCMPDASQPPLPRTGYAPALKAAWSHESTNKKQIEEHIAFYLRDSVEATVDGVEAVPQVRPKLIFPPPSLDPNLPRLVSTCSMNSCLTK